MHAIIEAEKLNRHFWFANGAGANQHVEIGIKIKLAARFLVAQGIDPYRPFWWWRDGEASDGHIYQDEDPPMEYREEYKQFVFRR